MSVLTKSEPNEEAYVHQDNLTNSFKSQNPRSADEHHHEVENALLALQGAPDAPAESDAESESQAQDPQAEVAAQQAAPDQQAHPGNEDPAEVEAKEAPEQPKEQQTEPDDSNKHSPAQILLQLERKERSIRDGLREIETRKREMQQESNKAAQQLEAMQAALKQDPLGTLQQLTGYDINQLANMALNGPPQQPQQQHAQDRRDPTAEKLEQLEQGFAEMRHLLTVMPKITSFESNVRSLLQQPEYELLRTVPNANQVANQYAHQFMQKYGTSLDDLTAKEVLDRMLDVKREELNQLKSSDVVRKYLGFDNGGQQSVPATQTEQPQQQPPPTLNSSYDESPGYQLKKPETMSHDDIIKAALKSIPKGARRGLS